MCMLAYNMPSKYVIMYQEVVHNAYVTVCVTFLVIFDISTFSAIKSLTPLCNHIKGLEISGVLETS